MDPREQIEKFQEFIDSNYKKELHESIRKGSKFLILNFQDLAEFDHELAEELLEDPEEVLRAAELSLENFDLAIKNFRIRFRNLPKTQEILIRNIRSEHLGRFLSFVGLVRQSSDVRPQVTSAKFECPSCGTTISILQVDTKFKEPTRCSCGRRGRFRLISKDLVDAQRLVIEESPESLEGGEQPKRLAVFLKEDLVEPKMERRTTPGSKIMVFGIIKEVPIQLKTGVQSIRYDLCAEANFIEPIEQLYEEIEISQEEEIEIKELAKDSRLYEKLVNSIAPAIYGHEKVKEALVLQLMGGVMKFREDGSKTRGLTHILLVGDPGAAKSSMLQFISKAAPKARFVAGRSTTAAGITATVVKDEFLRGWALEAGAVVLASKGILALDEMDKMSAEDTSALHESMEQQQISISKANIQATLVAETTILAAANPKLGRFEPQLPISAQINLPPTLINRFDLIFPVRDIPNKDLDEKIAQRILDLHQKPADIKSEIPIPLLKKYIAYAKQRVFPELTEQAIDEIKTFYVDLRNAGRKSDEEINPIPITARQIEALIRLAESSARVRLSNKVTRADAKRAINLLKHCLIQIGFDYETGQIDIDRITTGIPASQRSKIAIIRGLMDELEKKLGKAIKMDDLIMEAAEQGIAQAQVEETVERMKREGLIFEPKRSFLQRI